MIESNVLLGIPTEFGDICLIYPPTVKQIVGFKDFNKIINLLIISQQQLQELYKKDILENKSIPTELEYLLLNCYRSKQIQNLVKKLFLLFTKMQVNFIYESKSIIFGNLIQIANNITDIKEIKMINEDNYFNFQNMIRGALGYEPVVNLQDEKKLHPKIQHMRAMARLRDRVKKKQNSKNGITLSTSLIAICCMGLGITPLNIGQISYASVSTIMDMYQNKQKYDIDIRSLLAGASSKKIHPKYWIGNSDKN